MAGIDPEQRVSRAYRRACELELTAIKPGNVSEIADKNSPLLNDFLLSAKVSSVAMGDATLTLGDRIFAAVSATRDNVGHNTNLGILLLCAPIAQACLETSIEGSLQERLKTVLNHIGLDDTRKVYQAIRLAEPGGMGNVDEHDIHEEPQVTLLDAMSAAADRDRIAYQYVTGFKEIFSTTLPQLKYFINNGLNESQAITGVFLNYLAAVPDSLIARKQGLLQARAISDMIAPLAAQYCDSVASGDSFELLMSTDGHLKKLGINPGTTADIVVATLFLAQLERVV